MLHSYIKWQYIIVNDKELIEPIFTINTPKKHNALNKLKELFPELFDVLFYCIDTNNVRLSFPNKYYIGTDSNSKSDVILRRFLNDCSNNNIDELKPIELLNSSYPLIAYELFSSIITPDYNAENQSYGELTLGFNDTNGHVCSNGEEAHEISITISDKGIKWSWWPNE